MAGQHDDVVTVLAVDGNSLAHRAYHAIRETDDAVGHFVTAGVFGMLGSVWSAGPFDAVVVAFDHETNQRKLDFPEYKANRVSDPELRVHLDALQQHVADAGLHAVVEHGVEADDLLAAAADACTTRAWRCVVLSSDRDRTALVNDHVTLMRPRSTMSDMRVYDPAAVRREYGVGPDQYTDLAALRGDPSDGLAGVSGIGPKIAARLLRDAGGDEAEILARLNESVARDPAQGEAFTLLANVHYERGEDDEALEATRRALASVRDLVSGG